MRVYKNDDGSVDKVQYDESTGKIHVKHEKDVSDIIELNKRQFNEADRHYNHDVFNHVARIPVDLLSAWLQMKGIKYEEFMRDGEQKILKRFLNDPDNKLCRTKPGKLL